MTPARAPVLRGRDAELAAVATALEKLGHGRGHVLLVEGPPGIGKTALLAEAGVLAERTGARVLFGEAFETGRTVPFAPLLAALSSSEPPIVDARVARQLESAGDARYWVAQDLHSALEGAAAESALVIGIDDLHWADNPHRRPPPRRRVTVRPTSAASVSPEAAQRGGAVALDRVGGPRSAVREPDARGCHGGRVR